MFCRMQKPCQKGAGGAKVFIPKSEHPLCKIFFIFLRPPKNRCQKVEKRGQKGVFLG